MSEINFGNVAIFYEVVDVLAPDATYQGDTARQKQTRSALMKISELFSELEPDVPRRQDGNGSLPEESSATAGGLTALMP